MDHGGHGDENNLIECNRDLVDNVLTALTNVHRTLGPGLFESVYESATMVELAEMNIPAKRQVEIPVWYRGKDLGIGFRADIVVSSSLLLELKTIEEFSAIHVAQVITYLRLLRFKRGYLINFNKSLLKEGIKRVSI
jgi:GxxExxY protein